MKNDSKGEGWSIEVVWTSEKDGCGKYDNQTVNGHGKRNKKTGRPRMNQRNMR